MTEELCNLLENLLREDVTVVDGMKKSLREVIRYQQANLF